MEHKTFSHRPEKELKILGLLEHQSTEGSYQAIVAKYIADLEFQLEGARMEARMHFSELCEFKNESKTKVPNLSTVTFDELAEAKNAFKVNVIIDLNDECGWNDTKFSISPVKDPGNWIDSNKSADSIREVCRNAGLRVVGFVNSTSVNNPHRQGLDKVTEMIKRDNFFGIEAK